MMKKVTVKVLSGLGLSVLMVSAWAEPVQNANAPLTQQQVSRRVINNVANVEMNFNKGRNIIQWEKKVFSINDIGTAG